MSLGGLMVYVISPIASIYMQMSLTAVAPDGRTYIEFARLLKFFQRAAKLGGDGDSDDVEDGDGDDAGSLYFLVEMDDMVDIARLVEEVPMSLEDRFTFCLAPVDTAKPELMAMLRYYALQFYRDGCVALRVKGSLGLNNLCKN